MAVKSKTKSKSKAAPKSKAKAKPIVGSKVKSKAAAKTKTVRKAVSSTKPKVKKVVKKAKPSIAKARVAKGKKSEARAKSKPAVEAVVEKVSVKPLAAARPAVTPPVVKRVPMVERRRPLKPSSMRGTTFAFMKAPIAEYAFDVGDSVEVFCDHEKSRERVRGWVRGIVVQVDNKMVAVQFRSNVFLTDGWMVPDRILWYPLNSEHIRPLPGKKQALKKDFIPDY
jgi:hypothetical protein